MFVTYYPGPSLASMFRYKPIHEWSATVVQSRIDDYQRDLRGRGGIDMNVQSHTTEALSGESAAYDTV